MGTWLLIAVGVLCQYIVHKIDRPERLPVAIGDFIAYVICPLFVLYWIFPTLLNGWITLEQQLFAVGICLIPTTIGFAWHLIIRKKMFDKPVEKPA